MVQIGEVTDPGLNPPLQNPGDVKNDPTNDVGGGINNNNGDVPDPDPAPLLDILDSIVGSLEQFGGRSMSPTDIKVLMEELVVELENLATSNDLVMVNITRKQEQTLLDEQLEKLEKAIKKAQKAARKEVGKAFQILKGAANLALALGSMAIGLGMMVLVPGGMSQGAMMFTAGSLQALLAVDGLVETTTGEGLIYMALRAMGASEDEAADKARNVKIAIVALLVLIAVVCIASAIYNAATAAPTTTSAVGASEAASTGASTGASTATTSTATTSSTLTAAKTGVSITEGVTQLTMSGGDVFVAVRNYQSAQLRSDEADLRSDSLESDALVQVLRGFVEDLLEMSRSKRDTWDRALKTLYDLMQSELETIMVTTKLVGNQKV